MPEMLPVIRDNTRTSAPVCATRSETHPLVIHTLKSVSPSQEKAAHISPVPGGAWQWLKNRLHTESAPLLPEKMSLADHLSEEAGIAAAVEKAQGRLWLTAGVALTLFSTAGALAWGLARREENSQSDDGEAAISPQGTAKHALPQTLALASYPGATQSSGIAAVSRLQERVALLNATRDSVLAHFPGIRAEPTEHLLIGPLLEKLTASAAWRDVDKASLAQQLDPLVNVMLSTLSVEEQLQLYRHNRTVADDLPFAARFIIHNGLGHIALNQRTYPLRVTPEGAPFIIAMDGRCHFIRYNQRTGHWEYVQEADNQGYSAQAKKFNKKYRLNPVNLPRGTNMTYFPEYDYAGILSKGWINTWGVFISGNFISVWSHNDVQGETYSSFDCGNTPEQQLIIKGDYGWAFERPSVPMDTCLKVLLESKKMGVDNQADKAIGAIRAVDGLCIDRVGNHWLKKDNQYFRVQREKSAGQTITLTDYAGARAEYKNGVMQLKSAEEMIFALDAARVRNTLIQSRPFMIEAAALDYLQKNALTTQAKPVGDLREYHPGLAEDDDYAAMLVINNQKYAVREYTGDTIRVENKHNPQNRQQDIALWSAGDTLIRVRNNPVDISYKQFSFNQHTLPIMMEAALYKLLELNVKNNQMMVPPAGENLIAIKELALPIGWYDRQTRQSCFLYKEHYFPATFTDADDQSNPTGLVIVNVFGKEDFFTQQRLISSLVIEKKSDRIELKSLNSFLAEKLKVSKEIATLYNANIPWRNIPNIRMIQGLVSEAVAQGKSRLPQLTTITRNNMLWNTAAQRNLIKKRLYPGRVNDKNLEFFRFVDDHEINIPNGRKIYEVMDSVFDSIKKEILPVLDKAMHYDGPSWPIIKTYLRNAFGEISEELLSDIAVAWSERLRFIAGEVNIDNVIIVSANDVFLTQREKTLGGRVFVAPDGKHIYINAQKINPDDRAQIRLVSELLPALASPANSGGNFLFIRQSNGMYLPVRDASEAIIASLKEGQFTPEQQRFLLAESRQYLQRIPTYRRNMEVLLTPAKLAYLATHDPAYRAHLFLASPAFVTLLSFDAYYLLTRSEKGVPLSEPWLKEYGQLRASASPVLIEEIDEDVPQKITTLSTTSSSTPATVTAATEAEHHHIHFPDKHDQPKQRQPDAEPESVKAEKKPVNEPKPEVEDDERTHSGNVSGEGEKENEAGPEREESIEISEIQESEEEVEEAKEAREHESGSDDETEFGSVEEEVEEGLEAKEEESVPRGRPNPQGGPPAGGEDEVEFLPRNQPNNVPEALPGPRRGFPGLPKPPVPIPFAPPALPVPGLPIPRVPLPAVPVPALPAKEIAGNVAILGGALGVGSAVAIGIGVNDEWKANKTTIEQPSDKDGQGIYTTPAGNKTFPNPDALDKYHKGKVPPLVPIAETTPVVKDKPIEILELPTKKVFVPGHGNVTVITIPGLECLGDKTVTATQILRQVGKALQRPAVASALADQQDTHLDLYSTCPDPEDVEWTEKSYDVLDAAINTILMLPWLWPVFVLKNIVGPILEMAADDLEGIHASWSDRLYLILNAVTQAFGVARAGKITAKKSGGSRSVRPVIPGKSGKGLDYEQIGKIKVSVDGKEYPLDITFDENPVVTDNEGHTRFIHYNQQENHWDFNPGAEHLVLEEAEKNLYKYRKVFTGLIEEPDMSVDNNDIVTLKIKNTPEITGVFIGADFIPARAEKIGNEIVAYTTDNKVASEEQRLLVQDKYGWRFERSSVKKEINLEVLLRNKASAGITLAQKSIGAIVGIDGLSYDNNGEAYIKHDYKYYKVEKTAPGNPEGILKLVDFNNAIVKYSRNYFTLESADDFLFAAKTEKILSNAEKFRIEKAALKYLREHALTTNEDLPERIGTGIYQNTKGTIKAFKVSIDKFVISELSARTIKIKPANEKSAPVVLWQDRNTWFRVRTEPQSKALEYTDISYCRVARSPTGGVCAKISMETALHTRLLQEVKDEMGSTSVPGAEKLTEIRKNDIPYLYEDALTKKTYFKFGDRFFNAKIIEANSPDNPTWHPCLRVTGRSDFYRAERNIETIVMIDDGNVLKMAGLASYTAEKLGITADEAIQYIKKIPFNDIESIEILEHLTNDVLMAESIYVEPPGSLSIKEKSRLPMSELLTSAKKKLFPESMKEGKELEVYSYDLQAAVSSSYSALRDTGEFVSQQVNYIFNDLLATVISSLRPTHYDHPIAEDYLIEILKKNEINFMNDIEYSLSKRLEGARDELSKRQVKLLTTYKNPEDIPVLTGKNTDQMIFIHEEDSGTLFVNMDELIVKARARSKSRDAFSSVLVSALLQSSGKAFHIIELPTKNGIFVNVKNAYKHAQFITKHAKMDENSVAKMSEVISRYFENSPIYAKHRDQMAGMPEDARKFGYLLRYDPGFRAHITLNSDNFITLIAHDIHYLVSSSRLDETILHPWLKKYGVLREARIQNVATAYDIESVINSRVEISRLVHISDTFEIVGAAPGKRNMFMTKQDSYCFRWQGKYYPIEFLGNSGKVISVGTPQEMRQIYYYDPKVGTVYPLQPRAARMNALSYYNDLDAYERRDPWSDFREIAKYDVHKKVIVPTGATRIFRLPGKVTRIEFPWFNLYHPEGASLDFYVAGHGKILETSSVVPDNALLNFYINKGQQVVPYKGNIEDLLSDSFVAKEKVEGGKQIENYVIRSFSNEPVNNLYLARKYNKNIVQITSKTTRLSSLSESLAKLFLDDNIKIHLYTCRTFERTEAFDVAGEENNINVEANIQPDAGNMNKRWAFDQQVESGELTDEHKLTGFLPLRETPVFLHYGTIEVQLQDLLANDYKDVPYDIFYSLDISGYASKRVPPYLTEARLKLRENVVKAQRTLEMALSKLNDEDYDFAIRKYLNDSFENYLHGDISEEVLNRLKVNILRASDFLHESSQANYNNIGIVSSRQIASQDSPGTYRSAVADNIRENMPLAFVIPGDAFRRLFFIEDALPPIEQDGKTIDPKEYAQEHTIIHESSHITGRTTDILYSYTDMSQPPRLDAPGDSLKRLNEILDKGEIRGTPLWFDFMPLFYRHFDIKEPMKEEAVVKMIKQSPMLKANIIMENADSFAMLVQGIANLQKSSLSKRDVADPALYSAYQYLGMIFTATREHHLNQEPDNSQA
ncbi:putative adhesin [Vagococcus sp. WN89Y]|uniref:putative adhesin n=1 Tax=Vagococcus sp. WN89Y TaxID=3457258 RepID=UPI003FCE9661